MTEEGKLKMPKRLYFRLINNGKRLKFYFKEDVGGAYLSYSDLMEAVQHRGMNEGYADFVEDSAEWKTRTNLHRDVA
ncbi:MAG TPA: hypothetical protein VGS11_10490 [Candidatus Bathyarchaeia archaeon]|nr:hypothetical protein [Candidatus Bathyarchaeia archaeon]